MQRVLARSKKIRKTPQVILGAFVVTLFNVLDAVWKLIPFDWQSASAPSIHHRQPPLQGSSVVCFILKHCLGNNCINMFKNS